MTIKHFASERQLVSMCIEDIIPLVENAQLMREKDRKRLSRAIRKKPFNTIIPIFQEIEPSLFIKELYIKVGMGIGDNLFPVFFDLSLEKLKNPLYPLEDIVNIIINRELTAEQNSKLLKMAAYIPHSTIQNCILTICYRQSTNEEIQKYMNSIMSQIVYPFEVLPRFKDTHAFTGTQDKNYTSYINSVIVQLSYDSNFIKNLIEIDSSDFRSKLQDLLLRMHYSAEETVDSSKFIEAWKKISSRNITNQVTYLPHDFYVDLIGAINNKKIDNIYKLKICKNLEKPDGSIEFKEEECYSIPIKVDGFSSLEDSLNCYLNEEIIDNSIKQTNITFTSLPSTLVFNLQRFNSSGDKIKTSFSYPDQLIIDGIDYRFRGAVLHKGTLNDGVYSSIIYNEGTWLRYDGQVTEISEIEYRASFGLGGRSPVATMLFYENAECSLRSHQLKHQKAIKTFKREQNNNFIMAHQSLLQCRVLTQIAVKDFDNNQFLNFYIKVYMRAQIKEPEVIQLATDRMKEAYNPKIIIDNAKEVANNIKYASNEVLDPMRLYDVVSTQEALPLVLSLLNSIKVDIDKPFSLPAEKVIACYCMVVGNCREDVFNPILVSLKELYLSDKEIDLFKTINVTPLLEAVSYLMVSDDLNSIQTIIDQKQKFLINPENKKGFEKLISKADLLKGKTTRPRPIHERLLEMDDPIEISLALQEVKNIETLLQTLLKLEGKQKRSIVKIIRWVITPSLFSDKQSERQLASKIVVSLLPNIDVCKELLREVSIEILDKKNPVPFFAILYRCLKDSKYPTKFGPVGAFEAFIKKEWKGWSGVFAEVIRLGVYFDDCKEITRNIWRRYIDMDVVMPREVDAYLSFLKRYDETLFMESLFAPINKENMAYFKIRKKFYKNLEQTDEICRRALDWFAQQLELAKETNSLEEIIIGTYYIAPRIETILPTKVDPEVCANILEGITMPKMVCAFSRLFIKLDSVNENNEISNSIHKRKMSHKIVAFMTIEEIMKKELSAEKLIELMNTKCPPAIVDDLFYLSLLDNYEICDSIIDFVKKTYFIADFSRDFAVGFYTDALSEMNEKDADSIIDQFDKKIVPEDDPKFELFVNQTIILYHRIPRIRDRLMKKIPYSFEQLVTYVQKFAHKD